MAVIKAEWTKLLRRGLEEDLYAAMAPSKWAEIKYRIRYRFKHSKLKEWIDWARGITPLEPDHDITVRKLRQMAIDTLTTDDFDYDQCRTRRDALAEGILELIDILEDY